MYLSVFLIFSSQYSRDFSRFSPNFAISVAVTPQYLRSVTLAVIHQAQAVWHSQGPVTRGTVIVLLTYPISTITYRLPQSQLAGSIRRRDD